MHESFLKLGFFALISFSFFLNSCADDKVQHQDLNACGGFEFLSQKVGADCGTCGTWACDGSDSVVCKDDNVNSCGGCKEFNAHELRGEPCGECGKWKCINPDTIICDGDVKNACGGCAPMRDKPNQKCGDCGTWICQNEDTLECEGDNVNACGGCTALTNQPKDACGGCGAYVCDGTDAVKCVDAANACGGCGILDGEPGESCGTCKKGTWTCNANKSEVTCVGDTTPNECGGCTPLQNPVNSSCGPCNDGKWACLANDKEKLECVGAREKNICGGCSEGKLNDLCGSCSEGYLVCSNNDLYCEIRTHDSPSTAKHIVGPEEGGSFFDSDDNWYDTDGSLSDYNDQRYFWAYVFDKSLAFLNPEAKLINHQVEHQLCMYFRKDSAPVEQKYNCESIPKEAYRKDSITVSGNTFVGCCTTSRSTAERYLKLSGFGTIGADDMELYYKVNSYEAHNKSCDDLNFVLSIHF
ncbi:MAG: hypothetical protein WC966_08555 [Bradymonadales bacterium]